VNIVTPLKQGRGEEVDYKCIFKVTEREKDSRYVTKVYKLTPRNAHFIVALIKEK
jgi:hypothetical protein